MEQTLLNAILPELVGCLGITVSRDGEEAEYIVDGITINGEKHGWTDLPKHLQIPEMIYCITTRDGISSYARAAEFIVVDAPACVVLREALDIMDKAGAIDWERFGHIGMESDDEDSTCLESSQ